jgi:PleD family two-component response regulator
MGISRYDEADENIESVIGRTELALSYAKEHGRNQIINYSKVFKK